jgi:hypothetical protein
VRTSTSTCLGGDLDVVVVVVPNLDVNGDVNVDSIADLAPCRSSPHRLG